MKKARKTNAVAKMERRLKRSARSLAQTGLILHGSVNTVEGPPRPGAKPRPTYYRWTWKIRTKTHTLALSKAQAQAFQKAIGNHRKLKQTLQEMRQLSLQILKATTEGVIKRKRIKNQSDEA